MAEDIMVQPELRYAQFGKRAVSVLIDCILGYWIYLYFSKAVHSDSKIISILCQTGMVLVETAYVICFHLKWGQTIGKMVTKIKVVKVDIAVILLASSMEQPTSA